VALSVCPTAEVAASVEDVWALLADPAAFDRWWDARTDRIDPPGPSCEGQEIEARSAGIVRFKARLERVDPRAHVLVVATAFPFGLRVRTEIRCVALSSGRSRISFG